MSRNVWSAVAIELLLDMRILQLRKSVSPLVGLRGGSFGERQLNRVCGDSPLNGWKAWLASVTANITVPSEAATAAAGADPRSQLMVTLHPGVVGATPSHCSSHTRPPGFQPEPVIVNDCGLPAASPGTTNGEPVGCVIVPAAATPVMSANMATANTMSRVALEIARDFRLRGFRNAGPPPGRDSRTG